MKPIKSFVCGNCSAQIYTMPIPGGRTVLRNSCPECNWSRHVGLDGPTDKPFPPCGGMMKPYVHEDGLVTWRCRGCNFMMTGPSEKNLELIATSPFVKGSTMTFYQDRGDTGLNNVSGLPEGVLSRVILDKVRKARRTPR